MKISQINENIKAIVILNKDGLVNTYYDNFEEIENKNQDRPMIKILNPNENSLSKMLDIISKNTDTDENGEVQIKDNKTLIELVRLFTDLELDENDDLIEKKFNSIELLRVVGREVGRIPMNYMAEVFKNIKDYGNIPEDLRKFNDTVKENKQSITKKKKSSKKKVDEK